MSTEGQEGNDQSLIPAISADGRYVAFYSLADNLVVSDTNGFLGWDVFVHDRQTAVTERVSVNSAGVEGNGPSFRPDISADGRYVVFSSLATNLVANDANGFEDVFVHDRQTGVIELASVSSANGQGNGDSNWPKISADGRFVAFDSYADNLVAGDTNGVSDVFVHDRQTGLTGRVSISSDGSEGSWHSGTPAISGDGQFVAFASSASNLVANDTNGRQDIFVHDRQTGQTTRVSVSSTGQQANDISSLPAISDDGRYVAFLSLATNLVDGVMASSHAYVHDRLTGITALVSVSSTGEVGNDFSGILAISPEGRFVTFGSDASNLVPGDTNGKGDVFVHDQVLGLTLRVSVAPAGTQGNDFSWGPAIAAGGSTVAFWARASNLVEGDNNETTDVFVSQWRLHQAYLPFLVR